MEIRKATLEDAQSISSLIQKNTESNPNKYTKEQIRAWQTYNTTEKIKEQFLQRTIYGAFKQDVLVGTIGLINNEVVGFYIRYSQRGTGIGKLLYRFIENKVIENGFTQILLTSTPSAVNFYKKNGFLLLKEITVTIDTVNYTEFTMYKNLS